MENEKEARVLQAAKRVFLRHGFRRVTMQDIAAEAGISRPALYLLYPNKEEVFLATIRTVFASSLAAIRQGLAGHPTPEAKLLFAFEIWTVQPFELMVTSPDAKDLIECTQGFAKTAMQQSTAEFESLLAQILAPLVAPQTPFETLQVAHLIESSAHGFKASATSVAELRTLLSTLIALTTTALRAQTAPPS